MKESLNRVEDSAMQSAEKDAGLLKRSREELRVAQQSISR